MREEEHKSMRVIPVANQDVFRRHDSTTRWCCAKRPVKGRDERPAGALDSPLRAEGREFSFLD